jgi:ATP-dependent protease ClpP protease subunit
MIYSFLSTIIMMFVIIASASSSKTIVLKTDNTLTIRGAVTFNSMNKAIEDLIALDSYRANLLTPIYIVIDSPGGNIVAGNKFIRFANTLENVHTICITCISMGHAIVQGVKGKRFAVYGNIMMAHEATLTLQGSYEADNLKTELNIIQSLSRFMEERNAKRIGILYKEYKKKVKHEWWTIGDESIEQNIADEQVNIECSKDLINQKKATTVMTMFGPMQGPLVSECPLI